MIEHIFLHAEAASFTFHIIANYVDDVNHHTSYNYHTSHHTIIIRHIIQLSYVTSYNYHTSQQPPCPMSWPIYSVLQRFIIASAFFSIDSNSELLSSTQFQ